VDDAKLLVAIFEHGLGNWETIRDSDPMGLGKKILPESKSAKPQGSHLQTRAEYLLKLLQAEAKRKMAKKGRKSPRKALPTTKRRKCPPPAVEKPAAKNSSTSKAGPTTQGPELVVNIDRDLVSVTSDAESGASDGHGRKREGPASGVPPSKRHKSSPGKIPHKSADGKSPREDHPVERVSDDQRVSDIGEADLDKDTFEKVHV